jgi:hypothetical protein
MPYLRANDGTVYLEGNNPVEAWTPDEWAAEIRGREEKLAELTATELRIIKVPPGLVLPPEIQSLVDERNHMQSMMTNPQIDLLKQELAKMQDI